MASLWGRYSGSGVLAVNLSSIDRERDIIGGDAECLHLFDSSGYCACGAWSGLWGEEGDINAYWEHSLAFPVLNSHFNEVIIVSKRIIPLEYQVKGWSRVFGKQDRSIWYSVKDNLFLHRFGVKGGFKVFDYPVDNWLRKIKEVLRVNFRE
jgi:hypothetical protein